MSNNIKSNSPRGPRNNPGSSTATPNRDKPREAPVIDAKPGDTKIDGAGGTKPADAKPVGPIAALAAKANTGASAVASSSAGTSGASDSVKSTVSGNADKNPAQPDTSGAKQAVAAGTAGAAAAVGVSSGAAAATPASGAGSPAKSTPSSGSGAGGPPQGKPPASGNGDGSGKGGGGFAGTAVAGLVGAAVALIGAWGWQTTRGDDAGIAALADKIKANETVLASLKKNTAPDFKTMEKRIATLEALTKNQAASGAALQSAVDKIGGSATANSGQIAKFETRVAALEKLTSAAKSSIRATGDPSAKKPDDKSAENKPDGASPAAVAKGGKPEAGQDKPEAGQQNKPAAGDNKPEIAKKQPQTVSGEPKKVAAVAKGAAAKPEGGPADPGKSAEPGKSAGPAKKPEAGKPADAASDKNAEKPAGQTGQKAAAKAQANDKRDAKPETNSESKPDNTKVAGTAAEKPDQPAAKKVASDLAANGSKAATKPGATPPPAPVLPKDIVTLPPRFAKLETRLQDLEKKIQPPADLGPVNKQIAALAKKVEPLEQQVTGKFDLKIAPIAAALAKSAGSIAENKKELAKSTGLIAEQQKALTKSAGLIANNAKAIAETGEKAKISLERSNTAANAIVARTLLERIGDGKPFGGLVKAMKAMGANADQVAALQPLAEKGVASRGALISSFQALESKILAREAPKADAPIMDRLKNSAFSLVKVRPVGKTASATPGGLYTRILTALGKEQWAEALALYGKLPDKARDAAKSWSTVLESRIAAQAAAQSLLSDTLKQLQQQKS